MAGYSGLMLAHCVAVSHTESPRQRWFGWEIIIIIIIISISSIIIIIIISVIINIIIIIIIIISVISVIIYRARSRCDSYLGVWETG